MRRPYFLLLGLMAATACRQHTDLAQIKSLLASQEKSNKFIRVETERLSGLLKNLDFDPPTHARAEIWIPRAETVQKLSRDVFSYMDTLRVELEYWPGTSIDTSTASGWEDKDVVSRLFEKKGRKKQLLAKMVAYRQAILDSWRPDSLPGTEIMKESIRKEVARLVDDIPIGELERFDPQNTTPFMTLAFLNNIQSDLLRTENNMVRYAYVHTNIPRDVFDVFSTLIGISSSYLKAGQTLTVYAGVGSFSMAAQPRITINGIAVELNAEGLAEYKTVVNNPGKHSIRINIRFVKPDGQQDEVTKDIKYEVAN